MNFFGKYRALVITDKDPKNMGRIKVMCPKVYGQSESPYCLPCMPFTTDRLNLFSLPSIGSTIWIEFESGDSNYPIYVGGWWVDRKIPIENYQENLDVTTIKTKSGHTIILNDTLGNESIKVVDKFSNTFEMNGEKVILADKEFNTLEMNSTGLKVVDKFSNTLEMKNGSVIIETTGEVVVKSNNIKLGLDANESVPLGNSLKTWLDNHIHEYSWTLDGGDSVTTVPISPSPNPSTTVKVK